MILPIEASMHTPRHFDLVLSGTMAAVTALYVAFGAVCPPPFPSARARPMYRLWHWHQQLDGAINCRQKWAGALPGRPALLLHRFGSSSVAR